MLNAFELQRYLGVCADKGGLRIVYEQECKPRTNGKVVYLPHVGTYTDPVEFQKMIHFVNHESNHCIYTKFEGVKEYEYMSPMHSLLGLIWGLLEDHRVDYLNDTIYTGDRMNTDTVNGDLVTTYLDRLLTDPPGASAEELAERKHVINRLTSVLMLDMNNKEYYTYATRAANRLDTIASQTSRDWYTKMLSLGMDKTLRSIRADSNPETGTQATAQLAKDIWEKVFGDSVDEEIKKSQAIAKAMKEQRKKPGDTVKMMVKVDKPESVKGEDDGDDGDSSTKNAGDDGDTDGDGKSAGTHAPKSGDSKDPTESKTVEKEIVTIDFEDIIPSVSHEIVPSEQRQERGLNIKMPDPKRDTYYPQPHHSEYSVLNFAHPERSTGQFGADGITITNRKDMADHCNKEIDAVTSRMNSDAFAAKLRRLIQIRAAGRKQYGTQRGKLHQPLVHRILHGDSEASRRIFKKQVKSTILDTAVTILVDCSGSMNGDKYYHASAACLLIARTLTDILRIPVEILGFTDRGRYSHGGRGSRASDMFIFRAFDELRCAPEVLQDRLVTANRLMCQNADGESIAFAYDRLIQRKEKRKILIVLSDGQPVGGNYEFNIRNYTKKICTEIETNSPVDLVGIGIMSEEVTKYYKHNRVIADAVEIEQQLLDVLRSLLLKEQA